MGRNKNVKRCCPRAGAAARLDEAAAIVGFLTEVTAEDCWEK
jgi:hypothetical protein